MLTIHLSKSSSTLNSVHSSKCEVRTLQSHLDSTIFFKKGKIECDYLYAESFPSFYYLVLLIIIYTFSSCACSLSPKHLSFSIPEIPNEDTQSSLADTCLTDMCWRNMLESVRKLLLFSHIDPSHPPSEFHFHYQMKASSHKFSVPFQLQDEFHC